MTSEDDLASKADAQETDLTIEADGQELDESVRAAIQIHIQRRAARSEQAGSRARQLSLAVVATVWGLVFLKPSDLYEFSFTLLMIAGGFAIVALLADFAHALFGYRAEDVAIARVKDLKRDRPVYLKSDPYYIGARWSFRTRNATSLAGGIFLIAAVLAALFFGHKPAVKKSESSPNTSAEVHSAKPVARR